MKKRVSKKMIQKMGILASLTAVTLFIGHGCSDFTASNGGSGASSTSTGFGNGGDPGTNGGGFTPIPGVNTVSLIYNKQLIDNMVMCVGTGTPSEATVDEWKKRMASFSEYGYALDLTAPMAMALAAVSGEMCNDLLDLETALPQDQRRLFNAWDFTKGPNALTDAAIEETVLRFSLSCWARTQLAEENDAVKCALGSPSGKYTTECESSRAGVTDAAKTRPLALLMCTSMLASLSGIIL